MNTTPKKTTLMILGSDHLDNPGHNMFNIEYDDVLAPKRQAEIKALVERLKAFRPTKIAITVDEMYNDETQQNYQDYLKGTYQLSKNEYDQIGFRLAKILKHPRLYCVDYFPAHNPFLPIEDGFDLELLDYVTFAHTHNQEHLLSNTSDEKFAPWTKTEKYYSMIDIHRYMNDPENIHWHQEVYLKIAKIGEGNQYPGANWVTHSWHARNLKIFVNLTRITESAEDRILLVIPAGHIYLVQQFLEGSGDYIIEPAFKYLNAEEDL